MKPRISSTRTRILLILMLLVFCAGVLPLALAQPTNAASAPATTPPDERTQPRHQLQRLSPEQRRERIRALRQERAAPAPAQPASDEHRRILLERKINELRQKKADGSISPPEQAMLERLERALARRHAIRATNAPPQTGVEGPTPTNAPSAAASLP